MQTQVAAAAGTGSHHKPAASSMAATKSNSQRKMFDIIELATSGFEVKINQERLDEVFVRVHVDPKRHPQLQVTEDCMYIGGVWWLRMELPEQYPNRSPSVAFCNRIFHPNVEEASGSICLDVINQTWSPMYTLTQTVQKFLGQLLCYPNPQDPMNSIAAALSIQDPDLFKRRVQEHILQHASERVAAECIARETLGRSFAEPDTEQLEAFGARRQRQRRRVDPAASTPSPAATPSTPSSTPALSSLAPSASSSLSRQGGDSAPMSPPALPAKTADEADDDDSVSAASDIDLDL